MALAIFDLDNTLLAGDSDHRWGEFLVQKGLVDAANFARTNDQFYEAYQAESTIFDYMNQGMTFTGSIAYTF